MIYDSTKGIPGLKEGQPVYRFFNNERYADQLTSGTIMVSTLETCRKYEDKLQGDPEEAIHSYNTGNAWSEDPRSKRAFENFTGSAPIPGSNTFLINCTRKTQIFDAYVICTTEHFDSTKLGDAIGKYCVQIIDPVRFFYYIFKRLKVATCGNVIDAVAGKVKYQSREWTGNEPAPGPIGFVKPADPYEPQQEIRFLARIKNPKSLKPIIIDAPRISRLCKRIA
jgi:hypothetical protein